MLNWLNDNSGAVQGVASAVTTIVTVVLTIATIWYVRLTSKLANSAQQQYNLGQRQFELTQKQFFATGLPHLNLLAAPTLENPRVIRYDFANIGREAFRLNKVTIIVRTDKRDFEWHDTEIAGRAVSPIGPNDRHLSRRFEMPDEVWAEGLAFLNYQEVSGRVSWRVDISDVAGLVVYRCEFDRQQGYRVSILKS
jgi:hypothetical protein